jgi:DNA-binding MarR family transcriptional regulator
MEDAQTSPDDRAALLAALNDQLRVISGQSVMLSQTIADRVGLNPTDLESLDILMINGPITAGRLAELSGLTTGAVTGLVDRLEAAGYVQRARDPRDRRKVIVQLNVERLGEIAPLYQGISQAMDAVFARYSDQELAIIVDFATRAGRAAQEEIARLRALPPPSTA